jgi:3-methyladenine DNA glycosylase AlkC
MKPGTTLLAKNQTLSSKLRAAKWLPFFVVQPQPAFIINTNMTEQRLMKDGLGSPAISRLADALACTIDGFRAEAFLNDALTGLDALELKGRVHHIIGVMHSYLPSDFKKAAPLLIHLKGVWNPGERDDNLAGFAAWPIVDYIGEYGLDYPEESLNALKELTSLFSAEFAIRPFIIEHTELTFRSLEKWCGDRDQHVRRLVSEGSRPRLPWGQQLPEFIKDPSPVFKLLEKLKDDPSEYVRRSVANNLNDISKDHPKAVLSCCRRWQKPTTPERARIIRHATRTLVKSGHPEVFGLLGYTDHPKLEVLALEVTPPTIKLGESIEFSFQVQSTNSETQKVVIDYAIHHMKANGLTSPKVFKFCTLDIKPSECVERTKRHAIKPITTRKYYSGEHAVEILINGKTFGEVAFTLRVD